MERRKIRDEADARACLSAARRSGQTLASWGRSAGVDGRSLHAWSMNLARGDEGQRRKLSRRKAGERVELVELIAAPMSATRLSAARAPRYTVRVGKVGIELGDDFDAATVRRLVAVLAAC